MTDEEPKDRKNSKKGLWIFSLLLLTIAITAFCLWFFHYRFYKSTQDAYVQGNIVYCRPQIAGFISEVLAEDTHFVEEGQPLVYLDTTDRQFALDQASAALGESVRKVTDMFQNVYQALAAYKARQADRAQAEILYQDRKAVVDAGAVSAEVFIDAETKYVTAIQMEQESKHQLISAVAAVHNTTIRTHPLVVEAEERVKLAYVNLKRCTIVAPCTGIVAMRAAQVGETVDTEVNLMAVVPADQMWVNANYRETALRYFSVGQKVRLTADAYGGKVVYNGTIEGIAAGTGAVFSPLPPQNATGNWIKIVQRVPVRVHIPEDQLKKNPLRLGLSMHSRVDIRHYKESHAPLQTAKEVIYQTDIFDRQTEGVDEYVEDIIRENMLQDLRLSQDITSYVDSL